jgi:hypothetical protein
MNAAAAERAAGNGCWATAAVETEKSQLSLLVRGGTIVKETRDQAEKIRTNCQQVMRYR